MVKCMYLPYLYDMELDQLDADLNIHFVNVEYQLICHVKILWHFLDSSESVQNNIYKKELYVLL